MSLLNKLMDQIGLGVLHYFFYNDHSVGIVESRWRKILILATREFDIMFLQVSELKKFNCGATFPPMPRHIYDAEFSGVDDPNDLKVGVFGRCRYIHGNTDTYLVKVIDLDGSVICLKIPLHAFAKTQKAATADLTVFAGKFGATGYVDETPESRLFGPTANGEIISYPKMDVLKAGSIKEQFLSKEVKAARDITYTLAEIKEVPKEEPIETKEVKLGWFSKCLKFIFG